MSKSCTYTFKGPDGKEVSLTGAPAMKAYLATGGLEFLLGEARADLARASANDGPDDILRSAARSAAETEAFKRWSNGNPVVFAEDASKHAFETGSPVVVDGFHGSRRSFDRVDPAEASAGYFLSNKPIVADEYAGVMAGRPSEIRAGGNVQRQFVRMDNPLVINARGASFNRVDTRAVPGYPLPMSNTDAINQWAREQGYDGVIYKDLRDSMSSPDGRNAPASMVYGTFKPNFVKSVIGNDKTFDLEEDSFLSSRDRVTETPEFKRWFGDSKVVDAEGKPLVMYRGQRRVAAPDRFVMTQGRAIPSFVQDPAVASVYSRQLDTRNYGAGSNVMPVYLSIQNPLDMRSMGETVSLEGVLRLLNWDWGVASGIDDAKPRLGYGDLADLLPYMDTLAYKTGARFEIDASDSQGYRIDSFEELANYIRESGEKNDFESIDLAVMDTTFDAYMIADSTDWIETLSKFGFDGVIHKDVFEAGARFYEGDKSKLEDGFDGPVHDTYRPFEQTQVKSAIGNDGSYSGSRDITKSAARLTVDVPNEEWLQGKVDYAIQKGRNRWGVPHMSTITASFRGAPVDVPVSILETIPGQRDEQNNRREESLDYIRKNWDEVSKEPPYIEVAYNGEAWVSEGNHRIMVAAEKGIKSLPVEIRYFDGGERKPGPLAPDRILDVTKSGDREITIDMSAGRAKEQPARDWIRRVYEGLPRNPLNPSQRAMMFGDEEFALIELGTSGINPGGVEIKWIQAYPNRSGVGTKAIRELQRLAAEDNITLDLFPWDKGRVSQAKLIKFYKSVDFQPTGRGSKNMIWRPESVSRSVDRDPRDNPSFVRWFGDSVMTENGRPGGVPLVLYHGGFDFANAPAGKAVPKTGNRGALGVGFYLTPDESRAAEYADENSGAVTQAYVRMLRPLEIRITAGQDPMIEALVSLGMDREKAARKVETAYEKYGYVGSEVKGLALKEGYDGLVEYIDGRMSEVVAWAPTQIKSATDNDGGYSWNPDIRRSAERQTDTPEFKAWFKDSKVVDAEGKPLVVYHSTFGDFDKFEKTADIGFHFGSSTVANNRLEESSKGRGRGAERQSGAKVIPAYLSIQNPMRLARDPGFWDADKVLNLVADADPSLRLEPLSALAEKQLDLARDEAESIQAKTGKKLRSREWADILTKYNKPFFDQLRGVLEDAGYDGMTYINGYEGVGQSRAEARRNPDNLTYVAFRPEQIKSATGNSGAFDSADPDIRRSAERDAPEQFPEHIWRLHEKSREAEGYTVEPWTHPMNRRGGPGISTGAIKRNSTMSFRRLNEALKRLLPDDEQARLDMMVAMNEESVRREREGGADEEVRRSTERSPLGFYSALAKGIDDLPTKQAPAGAWKAAIKGLVNKGAAKADEVEWSGINDWLDLQQGKVSKDQVSEYLKQGGVRVEGVTLAGGGDEVSDADFAVMRAEEEVDSVLQNLAYARRMNHEDDIQALQEELRAAQEELRTAKEEAERAIKIGGPSKYNRPDLVLPGGEKYREVLLTLPVASDKMTSQEINARIQALDKAMDSADGKEWDEMQAERLALKQKWRDSKQYEFRSKHWDQPNVLAHIRVNDRTDADGKRVLFVEELQSDWGQEGKKGGFNPAKKTPPKLVINKIGAGFEVYNESLGRTAQDEDGNDAIFENRRDAEAMREQLLRDPYETASGVPAAPFVTKTEGWLNLALKRVMVMAAEGGYDKVAFVNGEQSAERYDLSKQVNYIQWNPGFSSDPNVMRTLVEMETVDDKMIGFEVDTPAGGVGTIAEGEFAGKTLEDVVGKEIAQKINESDSGDLRGFDLKVGGKGMKTFYDTIVPTALKKLLPKVGGNGVATVGVNSEVWSQTKRMGNTLLPPFKRKVFLEQPGFDVTEAMREKVSEGLPLFSRDRPGINVRSDGDNRYADLIVDGLKTLESRDSDSLRPYVGKTVGIVRTGEGQARLIGSAKIGEPTEVDATEFRAREPGHMVPEGSRFDIKPGSTKWLYPLTEAKRFDEDAPIDSRGIVSRRVRFSPDRAQTQTPEFRRWFGDSKVVDQNGEPLVVYHGTNADFDSFIPGGMDPELSGTAIWMSPNKDSQPNAHQDWIAIRDGKGFDARGHTIPAKAVADMESGRLSGQAKEFVGRRVDEAFSGGRVTGKNVMPLYVSLQNPAIFKGEGRAAKGAQGKRSSVTILYPEDVAKLVAKGYDGVMAYEGDTLVEVVAFRPTQVKSAIGNDGSYDETDPSILSSAERNWASPGASKFDDWVYKLQDKQIDTKRVVDEIKGVSSALADDLDVYLQEELFHGRAAKRTEDFVNKELRPLVDAMAKDGLKIEDLDTFLHARHAREANAVIAQRNPEIQDGGSGMTNQDAADYFANLDEARRRKLETAATKVDAILAETRKMMVDYQLESPDVIKGWGEMFQHYVPLMREDEGAGAGAGIGQGFSIKGREVKSRTGSTRKVVDIFANIAMQRERTIVRGEKNRVSQALHGLATANPNPDFWKVDQTPTTPTFNPSTGLVEDRPDPMFKTRENVIVSKVLEQDDNGRVVAREKAVIFDEKNERAMRMATALKNLDAAQLEGLMGASAAVTRYFASINTQYNPVFGIINLMRDVQGAIVNLNTTELKDDKLKVAKGTMSALMGIMSDARKARRGEAGTSEWSALWEDFQSVGGQTGYRQLFQTSADRAKDIERALNPDAWMDSKLGRIFTVNGTLKVPLSVAMKGARWLFDLLSDYNLAMENGIRLSAYKVALDKGMSRERAASLAKNLTVNFNRKGQVGQQAGALYAFFNAAMQGTARLGQTLFEMEPGKPKTIRLSGLGKKIVYGGMLLGTAQAFALALAGFSDDDPPDFVRERSLIIPTGGKTYISIPMPLGLHVIPNVGRVTTEWALSGFKNTPQRVASLLGTFADSFNPIGNAGWSMQTLSPTALDPLVALTENRDWQGRPIAKESMNRDMPGPLLHRDTATSWGKLISESINFLSGGDKYTRGVLSPTPDQIDYLIGQLTGGVGREISKVEQTAVGLVRGEEVPTYKMPLVGRLVGDSKSQASEGTAFYANAQKLNKLETEIKLLREDGKVAEAQALRASRPDAYLITQANYAERAIQRMRKEKSELIKEGAPRERVREIEEKITARMAGLNRAMQALEAAR